MQDLVLSAKGTLSLENAESPAVSMYLAGLRPNTLVALRGAVNALLRAHNQNTLTKELLSEKYLFPYIAGLVLRFKSSTLKQRLALLKSLGEAYGLTYNARVYRDFGKALKAQAPRPSDGARPLTRKEIDSLIDMNEGNRYAALYRLQFFAGLRVSELLGLTPESIEKVDGGFFLHLSETKSGQPQKVFVGMDLDLAGLFDKPMPLTCNYHRKLNRDLVKIGAKHASSHSFRVSHAVIAYDRGASIDDIQTKLRHKSSMTTRRYVKTVDLRKKDYSAALQ